MLSGKKNLILFLLLIFASCSGEKTKTETKKFAKVTKKKPLEVKEKQKKMTIDEETLKILTKINKSFAPTRIKVDTAKIKVEHRPVIKNLIKAGQLIDSLFLRQVSSSNLETKKEIMSVENNEMLLRVFSIMYGPWDRLSHNKPFWGEDKKPKGASFYPKDLTDTELTKWIKDHPDQKEALTSYFTVIKRTENGLVTHPYSKEYKDVLEPVASLLKDAAKMAVDERLKKYLISRAEAFLSNNYRESDMDWMDLGDGDLEIVIGPYEVYEDELMGYKAAFETFITLRDPLDSEKLGKIKSYLQEMENYLPIDKKYKNLNRGSSSPISVVDVLYTSGDTRAAVQTLAFNLPNDEVVREKKGSKKLLLKNVAQAKYEKILIPIAKRLLAPNQIDSLSFEAFFNHSLVHEIAHGLGPGKITLEKDGKKIETSVNIELKDLYSAIEEAKADVLGSYLNYLLMEKKMFPPEYEDKMYATLLGGYFRSVRFGAGEAHGKANIIQLNYLMEKGAVIKENSKYSTVNDKMKGALKSLAHDLLMIEAMGDYTKAIKFIQKYGQMPEDLKIVLDSMSDIPTDIMPIYPIEDEIKNW